MPSQRHLPRPLGGGWVFTKKSWFVFFLREISCVCVGLLALLVILLVRSVAQGPEAYASFIEWLESPLVVAYHFIALAFLLLHTITWFVAAPKALRPRIGDNRVPPAAIIAAHYAAWFVVSVIVIWLLL